MANSNRVDLIPKNADLLVAFPGAQLAKEIFEAENPEKIVPNIAPQHLYTAIQALGFESAGDIIALTTSFQYQVILDFEIWEKDSIRLERLWAWLAIVDEAESLEPMIKFIRSVNPSLLAFIIRQSVEIATFDEPTESPPWEGCYTPDQGYTWLKITLEDKEQHRLLGKLLAVIFQVGPEMFYQLISTAQSATAIEFEEELFQDQSKRLSDVGIPSYEDAWRLHSPLSPKELMSSEPQLEINPSIVKPPIKGGVPEPLASLITELFSSAQPQEIESFTQEFALIANAGMVFYRHSFNEQQEIVLLIRKVQNVIARGLEQALRLTKKTPKALYEEFGLQKLYRLGLFEGSSF